MKRRWTSGLLPFVLGAAVLAVLAAGQGPGDTAPEEILVSAASSLTDAMTALGRAFSRENPKLRVRFNFASSGALQQQIEQGAPVDLFASAGRKEMDVLQREGKIEAGARIDFAGNRLVLIAPTLSRLKSWQDLRSPQVHHVALSDPGSVPSGRYAEETLQRRGLWSSVHSKAILGENVRQTLTYVANGDADAGLVFATDALIERGKVRIVASALPGTDHAPITYPAAVIAGSPHLKAARRFLRFLQQPAARQILAQYGFLVSPSHPARPKTERTRRR